jgi:hypothetical protein
VQSDASRRSTLQAVSAPVTQDRTLAERGAGNSAGPSSGRPTTRLAAKRAETSPVAQDKAERGVGASQVGTVHAGVFTCSRQA